MSWERSASRASPWAWGRSCSSLWAWAGLHRNRRRRRCSGTLGLALFLYAVGIQYGKQFFIGLTSASGLKANLVALIGVLLAGAVTLLFDQDWRASTPGYALGLFAGSGTSTPALQAAIATLGNDDPAVGYSVAYPFGVAGPILFLYLTFIFLKPKIEVPAGSGHGVARDRLATPGVLRQAAGRADGRAARGGADRGAAPRRTTTSRRLPTPSSPRTTCCSSSAPPGRCSTRCARSSARRHPAASPRIAATSTTCASSRPGRRGGPDARRSRPAGRQGFGRDPGSPRRRRPRCRGRTSCSSSATASACSPTAGTSRPSASSSATRSRAPPSSATSPSAWAWPSASWSARSASRCPASARSRWGCRAC